ncbi:hypothetical protein KIN20_034166 [Parelaphostrongylus tenuis]|uniref:Uncharacterized protein n=1 Tax=Parelaphostrongylus tenuis TaxID=148309 RepID=A0AAD5R983_PARTN|nr:hypothetical protein KIN20_034166 [Parelaphostrongylus tenuis]
MLVNVCVSSISKGPVEKHPKFYNVNRISSKTKKSSTKEDCREKKKVVKTLVFTRQLKKFIKKIRHMIVHKFI